MSILKSTQSGKHTKLTVELLKSLHYEPLGGHDFSTFIKKNSPCKIVFYTDLQDNEIVFYTFFKYLNSNNIEVEAKVSPKTLEEVTIVENIWMKQYVHKKDICFKDFSKLQFTHFKSSSYDLK